MSIGLADIIEKKNETKKEKERTTYKGRERELENRMARMVCVGTITERFFDQSTHFYIDAQCQEAMPSEFNYPLI